VARAGAPALDAQVIARLERLGADAGEDLMEQLSALFLADADMGVVAMRDALAGDDAATVVRSAHTLRGASANVGANVLAGLCATLEADSASGTSLRARPNWPRRPPDVRAAMLGRRAGPIGPARAGVQAQSIASRSDF
jgi:HPt (histidine-containing phosphotransfer) domain-containing protein